MKKSNAPVLDIDPFSNEFLHNPYPYYEQLRETGPVVFFPKYNTYAMVGFEEVQGTLGNWETFSSGFGGTGLKNFRHEEPELFPQNIILEADPPQHTHISNTLYKALPQSSFTTLRDEFQIIADKMISDLVEKEKLDGVKDIADAFHLKVFGDFIGLEPEERDNLIQLTNSAFNEFGPNNEIVEESRAAIMGPVSWALRQSLRETLAPGSFGEKIYEQVDKGHIQDDEAGTLIRSTMTGSFNTIHSLSGILHCFAQFPDQWDILLRKENNYAVRSQAFDEVIRFTSPLQTFFRTTTKDTEVSGITIPSDSKVQLFLGAANRDPQRWVNPNRFDLERERYKNVAFGHGPHACIGQRIARMEADALLEALIKNGKHIALLDEPTYFLNNMLRGLSSLPISFKDGQPISRGVKNVKPLKKNVEIKPVIKERKTTLKTQNTGLGIDQNNQSREDKNMQLVRIALEDLIVHANAKTVDNYWAKDYKQHNPLIPTGSAVLKRFFTMLRPKDLHYEHGLCIADGDFVALHSTVNGFLGKPLQVLLDIFKIKGDKIVEHWDLIQLHIPAEESINGNAMFPIPNDHNTQSSVKENKQLVTEALQQLFIDRNLSAIDKYWAKDYCEHNPKVPSGRDAFKEYVTNLDENFTFELGFAMAYGEFVITHSRYSGMAEKSIIGGDIFRVVNGKITEHWDVLQEEVPSGKSINGNSMFPIE